MEKWDGFKEYLRWIDFIEQNVIVVNQMWIIQYYYKSLYTSNLTDS